MSRENHSNGGTAARRGWKALLASLQSPHEEVTLQGQVALITGGSRGLGLLLAREFAREGCRVAICARDADELQRARSILEQQGATVFAIPCDVTDQAQVEHMVDQTVRHFGRVDILVNNAGIIQVGPLTATTLDDFRKAMGVMFWGPLYCVLAVLPEMRQRRSGRIVNITSIGGKIAVPHLLPYSSAKFAATGLSEGLRAELLQDGITVTTIVPGLMRTGSYVNAFFKGMQRQEYTWFALGAALPFLSMDAERAAEQIVVATKRGNAEVILSLPASAAARFHGLFPSLTSNIAGTVNRFLPSEHAEGTAIRGGIINDSIESGVLHTLTTFGRRAMNKFNERYPK